jgi:hypothetical protein
MHHFVQLKHLVVKFVLIDLRQKPMLLKLLLMLLMFEHLVVK